MSDERFQKIDRIPSHVSPSADGITYATCNRQPYRIVAGIYTADEVRAAFDVPDDYDLWRVVPGENDRNVEGNVVIHTSGLRFFTSPKYINAAAGREPQPSDGPDFHSDHAAWLKRAAPAKESHAPESSRKCEICGNEPGFLKYAVEGSKSVLWLGRTCATWANAQMREESRHA